MKHAHCPAEMHKHQLVALQPTAWKNFCHKTKKPYLSSPKWDHFNLFNKSSSIKKRTRKEIACQNIPTCKENLAIYSQIRNESINSPPIMWGCSRSFVYLDPKLCKAVKVSRTIFQILTFSIRKKLWLQMHFKVYLLTLWLLHSALTAQVKRIIN